MMIIKTKNKTNLKQFFFLRVALKNKTNTKNQEKIPNSSNDNKTGDKSSHGSAGKPRVVSLKEKKSGPYDKYVLIFADESKSASIATYLLSVSRT